MEPLFQDVKALTFGKTANYKLPTDAGQWITEILKHFHDKHPWAGKYLTSVEIKEKNPEEGYGFGWVEISASTNDESASVKAPVLIKDNKLFPLDTVMNPKGEFFTLTPKRLDDALFKTDLFEKTIKQDELKDMEVVGPFANQDKYPNQRWGYLGGGSFKTGSLLDAIKDTIYDTDLQAFAETLSTDDELRKCAMENPAYFACVKKLHEAEKTVVKKASLNYRQEIDGSVMQIIRMPKAHYILKTANPHAYLLFKDVLDRPTALMKLGGELVRLVDSRGSLTVTTNSCKIKTAADENEYQATSESGRYHATTLTGSPVVGTVFATIVNTKGDEIPMRIFSSDGGYAFQEEIAGKKARGVTLDDIPSGPPKGFGVFFWDHEGAIKATEPLVVVGKAQEPTGSYILAHTMMGDELKLLPSAAKTATAAGKDLIIPSTAKFHPIVGDKIIPLADTETTVVKNASLKNHDRKFTITALSGSRFNFSGRCGLEKLSKAEKNNLNLDDAVFMATVLGLAPEFAEAKLGQAMVHGNTSIVGLHPLIPIAEYEKAAEEKLAGMGKSLDSYMKSLRHNLIKEAVIFTDEETVDKVLGLNFLNPDNIKVFVEYLPDLEEAQMRLNKLLVSTRIGLQELDEAALTNAIQGMEKTIEGLKILLHTLPTP